MAFQVMRFLSVGVYCGMKLPLPITFFFFFNDTATTEIYTLSLHDALPISARQGRAAHRRSAIEAARPAVPPDAAGGRRADRSEEHTSELQSRPHLVCRLLLEKKKTARRSRRGWRSRSPAKRRRWRILRRSW